MEGDNIISYTDYKDKMNDNQECLIDYITIKVAIMKIKHKILNVPLESKIKSFHNLNCSNINRKQIYQLLLGKERCYCETFWERKFDTKLHETTWGNVFKFVKEIKLQELQWKILHNIFPTNILLKRMGITQSEKCDYCGENDLIEHYFYLCERNRNLWTKVNQKIRNKIGNEIQLNVKVVLFGIEQDEIYDKLQASEVQFINNMLLIGKFSIIKSKTQNVNLSLLFDNELRIRNKDSNVS